MLIERVGTEDLLIRFESNPSTAIAQRWAEQFHGQLTGKEKVARIDAKPLRVLSSLLVGIIVKIYRAMERQGGTISVEISNEEILKVFQVFQLTRLFEVKVVSS